MIERENWEFVDHTWDDDGFAVTCRTEWPIAAEVHIIETSSCRGTAICPSCRQLVTVVSLNG